jgi:hypothetical protein
MKNLSRHTDLLCELETSLLMTGNQREEMSKLGWLIGLVKHAIWADSLYFLCLLLLSISKIVATSQFYFLECRTMDRVQESSNSECYTPSSEPFRIN